MPLSQRRLGPPWRAFAAFPQHPLPPVLTSSTCDPPAYYSYARRRASGMAMNIGQTFLHHAKHVISRVVWQSSQIPGNFKFHLDPAALREPFCIPPQSRRQPGLVEQRRMQQDAEIVRISRLTSSTNPAFSATQLRRLRRQPARLRIEITEGSSDRRQQCPTLSCSSRASRLCSFVPHAQQTRR